MLHVHSERSASTGKRDQARINLRCPFTARISSMNAHLDHVIDEALALIPQERSAVLMALLDSLEGDDESAVSDAWANEIARRKADLRSGVANAAPWAQARARLIAL